MNYFVTFTGELLEYPSKTMYIRVAAVKGCFH